MLNRKGDDSVFQFITVKKGSAQLTCPIHRHVSSSHSVITLIGGFIFRSIVSLSSISCRFVIRTEAVDWDLHVSSSHHEWHANDELCRMFHIDLFNIRKCAISTSVNICGCSYVYFVKVTNFGTMRIWTANRMPCHWIILSAKSPLSTRKCLFLLQKILNRRKWNEKWKHKLKSCSSENFAVNYLFLLDDAVHFSKNAFHEFRFEMEVHSLCSFIQFREGV